MKRDEVAAALSRMESAYDEARRNPVTGDPSLDVFLADLDPDIARLVRDLSVPHWFDPGLVRALAPAETDVARAVQYATSQPFVLLHPRGLRYHDSVRSALRSSLVRSDPERVRQVSRLIAESLSAPEADEEFELERLYCRLAFEPDEAMDGLYAMFQTARAGRDLPRCHQLIALAEEQRALLDEPQAARIDYMRGLLLLELHDYREAGRVLRKLRDAAANGAFPKLELHIGMALDARNQWSSSIRHYNATLKRLGRRRKPAPERTSDALEARLLHRLAFAELQAGKVGKAEKHVRASLKLNERTGDTYGSALNHELLGQIHLKLRDAKAAEKEIEASLALLEAVDRPDTRSRLLNHLGAVHRLRGELETARGLYREAMEARGNHGDSFEVAKTELDLGALLEQMGETEEAVRCYERAMYTFRQFRHAPREAETLRRLARIHYAEEEQREAIALLEQALALVPEHPEMRRALQNDLRRYRRISPRRPKGVFQRIRDWLGRKRHADELPRNGH